MSIADKLNYLNETKTLLKNKINALGGNIQNEDTFRSYVNALNEVGENMNEKLEKNFKSSNTVIEGSGQVTNALYWNAKRVNKFGGGEVSQDTTTGAQMIDITQSAKRKL